MGLILAIVYDCSSSCITNPLSGRSRYSNNIQPPVITSGDPNLWMSSDNRGLVLSFYFHPHSLHEITDSERSLFMNGALLIHHLSTMTISRFARKGDFPMHPFFRFTYSLITPPLDIKSQSMLTKVLHSLFQQHLHAGDKWLFRDVHACALTSVTSNLSWWWATMSESR